MRPKVFIGSSSEGEEEAHALQENLEKGDFADVDVWDQDIFGQKEAFLGTLLKALDKYDVAVFIFTPDDVVHIRGETYSVARDNVVFEYGLFMGRIGIENCFIIKPRRAPDLHLPSDLQGYPALTYNSQRKDNLRAALQTPSNKIRRVLKDLAKHERIPCELMSYFL